MFRVIVTRRCNLHLTRGLSQVIAERQNFCVTLAAFFDEAEPEALSQRRRETSRAHPASTDPGVSIRKKKPSCPEGPDVSGAPPGGPPVCPV